MRHESVVAAQQCIVIVERHFHAPGIAFTSSVVVQSPGDAPGVVGAFPVNDSVVVAAVAADQHAVSRDGDAAWVTDGRGDARGHVVAVRIFEERYLGADLHGRDAVLHVHVIASGRSDRGHQGAAVYPGAVAVATVEQGGVRVAGNILVNREHDDVRPIYRHAHSEVLIRQVGGLRKRLRGVDEAHVRLRGRRSD